MRFAYFQARTSCTRLRATEGNCILCDVDVHSINLVRAADRLSSLTALPTPMRRHTPFLTCALAMGVIIHTAVSLITAREDRDEESVNARIQLGIREIKRARRHLAVKQSGEGADIFHLQ